MKAYVCNYNGCIPDLSWYFEITKNRDEADFAVVWNEIVGKAAEAAAEFTAAKKPVFVVQHGWSTGGESEHGEHNIKPRPTTHFLVWSETARQLFIKDGATPENVHIFGCPVLDNLPKEKDPRHVVYAPIHADPQAALVEEQSARVWTMLKDKKDISLRVKLCEGEHHGPQDPRFVYSNRLYPDHLKICLDLIASARCVIVQDEGTFAFLAYALDVPVIKLTNVYKNVTEACIETDVDGLEDTLRLVLNNPEMLTESRRALVDLWNGYKGHSGEKMAEIIKSVVEAPVCA